VEKKEQKKRKKSGGDDAKDTQQETETVVIWHDGDEGIMDTIANCVNQELKEENIQVTFEKRVV